MARSVGVGFDSHAFALRALPANLLLVHAWGVLDTVYWNFPSWILSAEWLGYLLFPLFTAAAALRSRRPRLAVVVPISLFLGMFLLAASRDVLFTDMTAQIGALRIFPDFLFGAVLAAIARKWTPPERAASIVAMVALLWIAAATAMRFSDAIVWPAFGALIFGLAARGPDGPSWLHKLRIALGAISYSVYLVYLPTDIVYYHVVKRLAGPVQGAAAWLAWAGVFPVILAVGGLSYALITRPAARWLLARAPFSAGSSSTRSDA